MATVSSVAVKGSKVTVEWAVDSRERMPALEFFKTLERDDRLKVIVLFKRLADAGEIASREQLGEAGEVSGSSNVFNYDSSETIGRADALSWPME